MKCGGLRLGETNRNRNVEVERVIFWRWEQQVFSYIISVSCHILGKHLHTLKPFTLALITFSWIRASLKSSFRLVFWRIFSVCIAELLDIFLHPFRMFVWIIMIFEATSRCCCRFLPLMWGLENRNIDNEINICKACCKTFPEQTRWPFWFNLPQLFDEMMLSRTLELISDSLIADLWKLTGFPVADVNRNHI